MDAKANNSGANSTFDSSTGHTRQTQRWWTRSVVKYTAAAVMIGAIGASSWWYSCGYRGCPSAAELRAWNPTEGGALLDHSGAMLSSLTAVKRTNVSIKQIPQHVQAAFVAVEDRRFYTHTGIDWRGVARAAFENVKAIGVREGASTITMQLARNVFLSHRANERSISRKVLEWRYAGLIENALEKPEILERYLNAIYLGNGVYGVEGASQDLFGKSVRDVTLAEAAMLAGLPKAPSSYSPRRNPERASNRRAVVLTVLEREGVATPTAIAAARRSKIKVSANSWEPKRKTDTWAVETVRGVLDSLRSIGAIPAGLNDGQLRVRSTFDKKAQSAAERVIAAGAVQVDNDRRWYSSVDLRSANHRTQGALVALDPTTGALRAVVGGRRVERKGFNRAFRANRQAGSTFKPFVYLAALQSGVTSATLINDEPIAIKTGTAMWTPANYGDDYAGKITVRDALTRSANSATVRLSQTVGIKAIAAQAHAQGIDSDLPQVPSLALGAGGVTPLELSAAYAPFGNGGVRIQPYAVEQVEDIFGRVLWTRPPAYVKRVIDPREAFLLTSLLRGVIDEGTGRAVRSAGVRGPVAGKTGTTNDGADVWFVGYTPTLVATVWFGADTPTPLGPNATGGRFAAPVWARFIREGWHSPTSDTEWKTPEGVVSATIDVGTGKLANNWCGPSRQEWFMAGTVPTGSCLEDARMAFVEDPWYTDDESEDRMHNGRSFDPRAIEAQARELRRRIERERDRARNGSLNRARGELSLDELDLVMDAAREAIDGIENRRGRDAARRILDEVRRLAEQERRRRGN